MDSYNIGDAIIINVPYESRREIERDAPRMKHMGWEHFATIYPAKDEVEYIAKYISRQPQQEKFTFGEFRRILNGEERFNS